jgi:uncharacterized membrane protein
VSTTAALLSAGVVAFAGITMVLAPAVTKPTVPFGVRVPPERTRAPSVTAARHLYTVRAAAVAACCTTAAFLLPAGTSSWVSRLILLLELAAGLGCQQLARRQVTAAKRAEQWFTGRRQVVVADTGWRADPPRFPGRWLLPALAVIAVTTVTGVLRYPDLPAWLSITGGRLASKSPASAFAPVIGMGYVTALWTGLLLLAYRARPDLEAADPAASAARYRVFLGRAAKAVLALVACVNLSLLLSALRTWRLLPLSGDAAALVLAPFAAGLITVVIVLNRSGQGGFRLARLSAQPAAPGPADRDDDRFWKAGLLYVNRGDPALVVAARFGAGWTLNLANPAAWLVIAALIAAPAGIAAILTALGNAPG